MENQTAINEIKNNKKYKQMKKTNLFLLGVFTIGIALLTLSCTNNRATHDEGVVINGVRWATRNVDAPGRFATNPEDAGMFFQWNRRQGWAATRSVAELDNTMPTGTSWTRRNDPCPRGWRVPTQAELISLNQSGSTWTTRNGVNGRVFGFAGDEIFLPAAGWGNCENSLSHVGVHGFYWSNVSNSEEIALFLDFTSAFAGIDGNERLFGKSVRCVAK